MSHLPSKPAVIKESCLESCFWGVTGTLCTVVVPNGEELYELGSIAPKAEKIEQNQNDLDCDKKLFEPNENFLTNDRYYLEKIRIFWAAIRKYLGKTIFFGNR